MKANISLKPVMLSPFPITKYWISAISEKNPHSDCLRIQCIFLTRNVYFSSTKLKVMSCHNQPQKVCIELRQRQNVGKIKELKHHSVTSTLTSVSSALWSCVRCIRKATHTCSLSSTSCHHYGESSCFLIYEDTSSADQQALTPVNLHNKECSLRSSVLRLIHYSPLQPTPS